MGRTKGRKLINKLGKYVGKISTYSHVGKQFFPPEKNEKTDLAKW